MKQSRLYIKYRTGGKVYEDDLYQTQHYFVEELSDENGLHLKIVPRECLELISLELKYEHKYKEGEKFFVNGYQSWSTSREYGNKDKLVGFTKLAKISPFTSSLAAISGDYKFKNYTEKPGVLHSYTYCYFRNDADVQLFGSLSEAGGYTIFNVDYNSSTFVIQKDVEGLTIAEPYVAFDIVKIDGAYDEVFDKYFEKMGVAAPRIEHLAGYTSWYNYFTKISESIILRDLEGLDKVKDKVSIFQIDDGYESAVGDWLIPKPDEFPSGMKHLADKIHSKGYLAGIWLAPFSAERNSKVAKEHPDWLIKKPGTDKPLLGCVGWGGAYTLDIYNKDARVYIKKVFDAVLNDWGYDMVKLDFLYSEAMLPRNNKTRGTIMTEAMQFLRECVGDKLILGCGVPLGPAFGYVDACRISCDVDLNYKGKFYNKLHINREIPSAQNAITNTVFRRHLNGRVFVNDPDVFFLRDFNLKFNDEQKAVLAKVNNLCGNVLFVSDDAGRYGDKEIELLKAAFEKSRAKITSAEFISHDTLSIGYTLDGQKKRFEFYLSTGQIVKQ